MKNLDAMKNMDELRGKLFEAINSGDEAAQKQAFSEFAEGIENAVAARAKAEIEKSVNGYSDEQILVARGLQKPLTSEERRFFNEVIQKKGFEGLEEAMPKTIVADVIKNIKEEHPLLSRIDMTDTEGLAQFISGTKKGATAFWGSITADIKQIILSGFKVIDLKSAKLSGFIPVSKGMLELGPNWLANYVMTIIREIMAASLELAVVAGTGKEQPIGMMKKLSGATDSVYPDKAEIILNDFKPKTLAGVRAGLAKAKTDSAGVCVIVNPETYWAKVFPALAFQTVNGTWVTDKLATGEEIIKSYAAPADKLIFGDPQNYFLGVSSQMRVDRYKETLAIEDMDLYIAKMFGFGLAKDQNAFFVTNISSIEGATVPALETHVNNTGNNSESIITGTNAVPGV